MIEKTERVSVKFGKQSVVIAAAVAETVARSVKGERRNDAKRFACDWRKGGIVARLKNTVGTITKFGERWDGMKGQGMRIGMRDRKSDLFSVVPSGFGKREQIRLV